MIVLALCLLAVAAGFLIDPVIALAVPIAALAVVDFATKDTMPELGVIIGLACFSAIVLLRRHKPGPDRPLLVATLVMLLACLASFPMVLLHHSSVLVFCKQFLSFAVLGLWVPVGVLLREEGPRRVWRQSVVIWSILFAWVVQVVVPFRKIVANTTILQSIHNLQVVRTAGNGGFLVFVSLCFGAALLCNRGVLTTSQRRAATVVLGLAIDACVVSFTRTVWISVVAGALCLAVILWREVQGRVFARFAMQVASAAVMGIVVLLVIIPGIVRRTTPVNVSTSPATLTTSATAGAAGALSSVGDVAIFSAERAESLTSLAADSSFGDRVNELKGISAAIVGAPEFMVVGNGLGVDYRFYSVNKFSWGGGVGWKSIAYSHDFYAYELYAVGIVGLVAFLWFVWSAFRRSWTARRDMGLAAGIVVGIAAEIVMNLAAAMFVDKTNNILLAVMLGIVVANTMPDRVPQA